MNLNITTGVSKTVSHNTMNMAQPTRSVLDNLLRSSAHNNYKACLALALFVLMLSSCSQDQNIYASFETPPVITAEDAADDPAIIVNFKNPSQSLIFGTDKKSGVYLYDLKGRELGYASLGNINNIDVRQLNGQVLVTATNRSIQAIEYWTFDQEDFFDSEARPFDIFSSAIKSATTKSAINVYGICMGLINSSPVAFVTEDMGPRVELWTLDNSALVGTFDNGGESEGCVYDDENQILFISEEETNGVLKAYDLTEDFPFESPVIVDSRQGNIGGDPEGVAIYKTSETEGYVVLSSQGDSKYNLYDRNAPYTFLTSFQVLGKEGGIDGTSDTDGIAVSSYNFRGKFFKGLMVVQDGYNYDGEELKNQNFKIVSFQDILRNTDLKN
ncbi:MAG: phytase [Proteobacteria bacterium]|nr:phytase [Pseudomonadota bacterium]